jgi:undecaprenyl-diphosphatase
LEIGIYFGFGACDLEFINVMNFLHAIILGLVEGITEFLPISSTGHLILTAKILELPQSEFLKSFEIAIQLGAILAVVVLYWRSFFMKIEVLKKVAVAFIPTAILGLIFYKIIKQFLLESEQVVLWSLFLGGIFLIVFELFYREKKSALEDVAAISWRQAFTIGLFQSIAMVPGVSRAAATVVGGLILGLKRKTIVEFSFLLAVPTMAAATGLDLLKSGGNFSMNQFSILTVGFLISFLTAILAIKFLLRFIKTHSFVSFGVYRIILALLFWFLF